MHQLDDARNHKHDALRFGKRERGQLYVISSLHRASLSTDLPLSLIQVALVLLSRSSASSALAAHPMNAATTRPGVLAPAATPFPCYPLPAPPTRRERPPPTRLTSRLVPPGQTSLLLGRA